MRVLMCSLADLAYHTPVLQMFVRIHAWTSVRTYSQGPNMATCGDAKSKPSADREFYITLQVVDCEMLCDVLRRTHQENVSGRLFC
jgi:hypothetical protein